MSFSRFCFFLFRILGERINKIMTIKKFFELHERVVVAVSGGVDSAVLLFLSKKYAKTVYACFVNTEFQPQFEFNDAKAVCNSIGVDLNIISMSVLESSDITNNPSNRCYYCKKKIFSAILDFAKDKNAYVLEGTNFTDDITDRPGYKAIKEFGVLSPLRECCLSKSDIRKIAEINGIPVYDKPSYACLATRIPFGTEINANNLNITEVAEKELMERSFTDFRIRYNNGNALLELTESDRELYFSKKGEIDSILSRYYNSIDLSEKVR